MMLSSIWPRVHPERAELNEVRCEDEDAACGRADVGVDEDEGILFVNVQGRA